MNKLERPFYVVLKEIRRPGRFPSVILCGSPKTDEQTDNLEELDAEATWRKLSPFPSGRAV